MREEDDLTFYIMCVSETPFERCKTTATIFVLSEALFKCELLQELKSCTLLSLGKKTLGNSWLGNDSLLFLPFLLNALKRRNEDGKDRCTLHSETREPVRVHISSVYCLAPAPVDVCAEDCRCTRGVISNGIYNRERLCWKNWNVWNGWEHKAELKSCKLNSWNLETSEEEDEWISAQEITLKWTDAV